MLHLLPLPCFTSLGLSFLISKVGTTLVSSPKAIHSLIEHLLCAKHCSGFTVGDRAKNQMVPTL